MRSPRARLRFGLVAVATLLGGWLLAGAAVAVPVPLAAVPAADPEAAASAAATGETPDPAPATSPTADPAPGTTTAGPAEPASSAPGTAEGTTTSATPSPSADRASASATATASASPRRTTATPSASSSPGAAVLVTTPPAGRANAAPAASMRAQGTAGVATTVPSTDTTSASPTATASPGATGSTGPTNSVTVDLGDLTNSPSAPIVVILGMTLLSLAPAILLTCTSFTKILVVLGLTRNALGLQQIPPNQVLVGLALFLSLFVMGPVLSAMHSDGLQPYLDGTKTASQALDDGIAPLRDFMLDHTDDDELALLTNVAGKELPASREEVSTTTLVPAFVLTELKQAFTIGFIVFVPFLVIDMVVSGALMALGMMMMPPVMVSLPFKLLLFVMVNGWGLVIESLVSSYGLAP